MRIKLFRHQLAALSSEKKHTLLLSGVGGGKTWTGVHWCIKQAANHPKALGFIGANTFSQLRDSTLRAVFNELDRLNIKYNYNKSTGYLEFLGKSFLCRSLENYDVLRGIEIGDYWIDECAYSKKEAFEVLTGRLRDRRGCLMGFATTTPKGYNWVYDYFHPSGENHSDDFAIVQAKSSDNKYLPDGYLDSLKSQYDEKLLAQELGGEFVSLTQGKAYYAFDRSMIKEVKHNGQLLYTGMDFNVDPMSCSMAYVEDDKLKVFSEEFHRNSNTPEISAILTSKYGRVKVVPDSTGKNRKTSGDTDFLILKNHGHEVIYNRNPHVIDRINNLNRLFRMGKIEIDPSCKKLINDLEKVMWKSGANELDKTTDKLLTHISDGLGYLAWYLFPMYAERKSFTRQL